MNANMISIGKKKIDQDVLDCKTKKTLKKYQKDFRNEGSNEYEDESSVPTRFSEAKKVETSKKAESAKKLETQTYSPDVIEVREFKMPVETTKGYFSTDKEETKVESLNYGEKRLGLGEQYNNVMANIQDIVESALSNNAMQAEEIENIINLCEETACMSIMGEEEPGEERIFDMPDEAANYDAIEADEVTKSVQKYMYDLIRNGNKSKIPEPDKGFFPSLDDSNPTTSKARYKNSASSNEWEKAISKNPFFEGKKDGSSYEILNLVKHFPTLDLALIRYCYSLFEEDYDATLDYLKKNNSNQYQQSPIKTRKKTTVAKPQVIQTKKYYTSTELYSPPEVEQILREMSFQEIREEYHRHRQVKAILDRTAAQARSVRSYGGLSGLTSISQGETNKLRLLEMASKKHILSKYRENNCLFGIDLHGLYWDEAKDIINEQIDYIILNVLSDKSQYRYNSKMIDGTEHLCYEIITGKGHHSKGGFSVLNKNLCQMFEAGNYRYKEGDGKIYLYLAL